MKTRLWLIIIVINILLVGDIYSQSMKPKNFPILYESYGIRYEKYSDYGSTEENFLKYTGRKYKPQIISEGYKSFDFIHYKNLIETVISEINDEEIKTFIYSNNLIDEICDAIKNISIDNIDENEVLVVHIRTNPKKKYSSVHFDIYPVNEDDNLKLRIYNNRCVGGIMLNYAFNGIPIGDKNSKEFKKKEREGFERLIMNLKNSKCIYEIGVNDSNPQKVEWQII